MSSRKSPLLSEGTVRRFMKLATLDNLTENFVDTLDEEEEEVDLGAPPEGDVDVDDLAVADDVAPLEDEAPAVDVDPETVEALVGAIADAIGDVTGVDVSVEGGEPPAEELPMDAEGEPAVEPEPEPELDADVEPLEETDETNELEEGDYAAKREDDDIEEGRQIPADLVEELTRRVAARLVREAKK